MMMMMMMMTMMMMMMINLHLLSPIRVYAIVANRMYNAHAV